MGWSCETEHTARKAHICDECVRPIEIGSRFVRWAGVTDGEFGTYKAHAECRAAVYALNEVHGTDAYDWIMLCDREPEDREWICLEHPVVAERLGISLYDWREPRFDYHGWFAGDKGSVYHWQQVRI